MNLEQNKESVISYILQEEFAPLILKNDDVFQNLARLLCIIINKNWPLRASYSSIFDSGYIDYFIEVKPNLPKSELEIFKTLSYLNAPYLSKYNFSHIYEQYAIPNGKLEQFMNEAWSHFMIFSDDHSDACYYVAFLIIAALPLVQSGVNTVEHEFINLTLTTTS